MKILVLLGSSSPEREVSLRSGRAVAEALKKNNHQVYEYDPIEGYDGLDVFMGKVDVVLPIIHGLGGEDGSLQAELERRGFKYLGADSAVSVLCFDKFKLKELLNKLSILTPISEVVNQEEFLNSKIKHQPYVLKPLDGGSSIDTLIVRDPSQEIDLDIFNIHPKMLLEQLIEGVEVTIPVLGDLALPVIEIIPPEGSEFDYENKYNGETQELCPPVNISKQMQSKAQQIAEQVHMAAGVRHLSRTDIIITSDEELYTLEINTIPGLTNQSLYPKAAEVVGISMEALVDKFVQMAMQD